MSPERLSRRSALWTAAALGGAGLAGFGGRPVRAGRAFNFEDVAALARIRAASPYDPVPAATGPDLDADAATALSFRADRTLLGGPGQPRIRLFPTSRQFPNPVLIHLVEAGRPRAVRYNPDFFAPSAPRSSEGEGARGGGGFAGFRVLNEGRDSDWMAFLGASYFRTAGAFDQYGASARGLSLNAGGPGPEEFPRFTAFWLEPLSASSLTVYALLDGPSVSGAYRIASRKTEAGVAQSVRAVLFFRRAAVNLGLAPLTSMFWYGAGAVPPGRSAYPQVHDSDGLALWTGAGERLWRPLDNPPRVLTNTFLDRSPRAFGLLQRDRAADHYQDRQALYERRPNLWVRPLEGFAQGSVRLLEIPTDRDTTDNIVAFWSPSAQPKAGRSLSYAYDLDWMGRDPSDGALAQVAATRTRPADASGGPRRVQVDFQGPVLKSLGPADRVEAVVTQPSGTKLAQPTALRVGSEPDLWRVEFDLPSNSAGAINLRAFLRLGERTLSETWIDQIF